MKRMELAVDKEGGVKEKEVLLSGREGGGKKYKKRGTQRRTGRGSWSVVQKVPVPMTQKKESAGGHRKNRGGTRPAARRPGWLGCRAKNTKHQGETGPKSGK